MQTHYDYKRYAVLYVDDEEMALKYFERTFGAEFRVLTANNAADGMKLIEEHGDDIGVLLTDQRMPGDKGVQLLERTRQLRPRIVRMLITAYADFGVTVDAVNVGNIFRYISKPIQVEDMRNTLQRAVEFHTLQRERDDLLREKLSVLQNMVITDRVIGLGVLAAGLNRFLRNSLEAVEAFLRLTPSGVREQSVEMDRLKDPAFWRDFHAQVVQQSGRIGELVGALDGTGGQPAAQPVNVTALIEQVVSQRKSQFDSKGIAVHCDWEGAMPPLPVDGPKFQRMFELLLEDELAVLPAGAQLLISGRAVQMGDKPAIVQIAISDNGPGLPSEAVRSVFDPFSIRGSGADQIGINLLAVFLLVHHHGGQIEARQGPTQGAVYQIDLPMAAKPDAGAAATSRDFVTRVLMNDTLWERLLASN